MPGNSETMLAMDDPVLLAQLADFDDYEDADGD